MNQLDFVLNDKYLANVEDIYIAPRDIIRIIDYNVS